MDTTTDDPRELSTVDDDLLARPTSGEVGGDTEARFAGFFAAHWAPSYRLAGLMGADDPENVAQEALARLHPRFARLGTDQAERYLRATVCNLSRSTWRRRQVADRALPRLVGADAHDPGAGLGDADAVLTALRDLSARQRQVIVLRYWLELSESEIAETLGVSTGSVKTHASRGMQVLRKVLDA